MDPMQGRPPGPPFYSGPPGAHPGQLIPGPPGPFGPHHPQGPFPPPPLLPPGWTEHKAPDGMAYYYNAASGQSSWVRPTMPPPIPGHMPPPGTVPPPPGVPAFAMNQQHQPMYPPGVAPPPTTGLAPPAIPATSSASTEDSGKSKKSKKVKKEKAVKKTQILDTPWFIVTTNLENTFFYNKETKASIWVPTRELEIVLAKMGQVATERLEAERRAKEEEEQERLRALKRPNEAADAGQEGEKRSKNDSEAANAGTEMTEDDVAWQLAAMEGMMGDQDEDQHMDSQDESEDEDDEAVHARLRVLQGSASSTTSSQAARLAAASPALEILPDNIQEREMAFMDMMRDRGVTQFDTWEKAMSRIEIDPRIRLIPNSKDRQALFDSFCLIRAQEIKDAKEKEARKVQEGSAKDSEKKQSRDSKSTSVSATSSSSSKPEDVYRRLVEDYTTKTSTWLDFMTKYRIDPRFLGLKPGSLRESIFRQYLSDLKKGIIQPKTRSRSSERSKDKDRRRDRSRDKSRDKSSKGSSSRSYKATKEEIEEFMSLLKETKKDILHEHKHSSSVEWRKIKKSIDRDRRYEAVGSSTEREKLFREYADRVIQRRD
ncbi:transcription elongation regulator [Mortierella alpina]|nr:transcription elongation regulator [Mortierella alpina]